MELDNYITILKETLERKRSVLQALLDATRRQSELAEAESFDLDGFEASMEQKDVLLEDINTLDDGFDQVFRKIREELSGQKERYRADILQLQELIRGCTDLGVEIQTMEERNRSRLELVFSKQQKEIRRVKTNSKTVSNYYKTMNSTQNMDSLFMDQKK